MSRLSTLPRRYYGQETGRVTSTLTRIGTGKLLLTWSPAGLLYKAFAAALKYFGVMPARARLRLSS